MSEVCRCVEKRGEAVAGAAALPVVGEDRVRERVRAPVVHKDVLWRTAVS